MSGKWLGCGLLVALTAVASAQLTQSETRLLDDGLFIGNLSRDDLKFTRRAISPLLLPGLAVQALDDPLATIDAILERAAQPVPTSGRLVASLFEQTFGPEAVTLPVVAPVKAPADPRLPESLRPSIDRLLTALSVANACVKKAIANVPPEKRRPLIETLPRLAPGMAGEAFDFVKSTALDAAEVESLLAKVDQSYLRAAALVMTRAVEAEMPSLRAAAKLNIPEKLRWTVDGMVVEIAGTGNDVHASRDALFLLDLGGRNHYPGRYAAGIGYASMLIDLGGDAVVEGPDANFGCGILGVGLAVVNGGHASFRTKALTCGAGLAGVGILLREGGNDTYRSGTQSQGFGYRGTGILIDTAGDDTFDAPTLSQGASFSGGLGALVDRSGSDRYRLRGDFGQGFGSLGVGLLWDQKGNDNYEGGSFSQAAAIQDGLGILLDEAGEDTYTATTMAQAAADQRSAAFLLDLGGDDVYTGRADRIQALARDHSVAVLLDREGDDSYTVRDGTRAGAFDASLALLLDDSGDDRIHGGMNGAAYGSIAIFATGGGERNITLKSGEGKAVVPRKTINRKRPPVGSIPAQDVAALLQDYRKAIGTAKEALLDRIFAIGLPALDAWLQSPVADGSDTEDLAELVLALGEAGDKTLRDASKTQPIKSLKIASRSQTRLEGLEKWLRDPGTTEAALAYAASVPDPKWLPEIDLLAASPNSLVSRAALSVLDAIGQPLSLATFQVFIPSPDPLRRAQAVAFLGRFPAQSLSLAQSMLASGDERTARLAIQILGRIATEDALNLAGAELDKTPGRKIEALKALDGRAPAKFRAKMLDLRRDPNDLVRLVANEVNP
ncbi:MAG: HEAT repeat domain-containing protein [Fimbriimonas sp.]